jgi:exonuclease SbcC
VLADILDLAKYDRFEAEAKDRRRQSQQNADRFERELESIRARLAPAGELNDRLRLALLELRAVSGQQATLTDELISLQNARSAFEATTMALADLERQIAADVSALREAEAELTAINATLAAEELLHAAGPAIQRGYDRLERARATEREWSAKLFEVQRLEQRMQPLYQQLASTESRDQARTAVLEAQRDEVRQQAGQLSTLDAHALELRSEMTSVEALEARADLIKEQQAGLRVMLAQLRADEMGLRQCQRELEAQYGALHGEGDGAVQCPVCGGTLTAEAAGRLTDEVCNKLRQASDKLGATCRAIEAADEEISRLSDEETELRRRFRSESERLRDDLARTEAQRERALAALDRVRSIDSELEQLRQQSARSSAESATRRILAGLAKERDALAYDGAKHRAATRRVEQLHEYEARHQELTAAIIRRDANLPARTRQETLVHTLCRRLEAGRERAQYLKCKLAEQPDPRDRIRVIGGQLAEVDGRRAELDRLIGGLEAQVRECEALQHDEHETRNALATARRDEATYADLAVAFGRNGVQAFVIDAVVPEIEAEANRLLDLMTGGEMSIQLRTQRETRAGDLAETLDLVIADRFGPRDYEMYSGGEAFRINLALRIALARLLARRAGAPLSTLIIDEGFGSQDAGGRDRIVEAVSAIREDFRCLLVVTHIEELKQQFDTRIEVRKGERGSIAEVVRV